VHEGQGLKHALKWYRSMV